MRKGRNVGRYEMAEDRFFNESSERDYLYDDMMDAVSELIIGTIGNVYSRTDDWIDIYDAHKKQQSREKIFKFKGTIRSAIHNFMSFANDIQVAIFVAEYILGDDIRWVEDYFHIDNVRQSQLAKLFSRKLPKENIKITSIYDLQSICKPDDFIRLESVYDNLDEIYRFEKFKITIRNIATKISNMNMSYNFVFGSICEKIHYSVEDITIQMYRDYKDFIDANMDICKFCFFLYNTNKYDWIILLDNELSIIKGFIYGDMRFFNKLTRKKATIDTIDIAIALNKDWTVRFFNNDLLNDQYTAMQIAERMYYVYDCIHSALDKNYVRPFDVDNIIKLYDIGDRIVNSDIIVQRMIRSGDVLDAIVKYSRSPYFVNNIDAKELVLRKFLLNSRNAFDDLYKALVLTNPRYLLQIYGSDDMHILSILFMHLRQSARGVAVKYFYPEQSFLSESAFRYARGVTKYYKIDCYDYLKSIFTTIVGKSDDDFRRIVIRILNSVDTGDIEFIKQDIKLLSDQYDYLANNIMLTNK